MLESNRSRFVVPQGRHLRVRDVYEPESLDLGQMPVVGELGSVAAEARVARRLFGDALPP